MRNTKISPVETTSVRMIHGKVSWTDPNLVDDHCQNDAKEVIMSGEKYDLMRESGYWHARSVFLRSYHFTEDKQEAGWKKKVMKRVKEVLARRKFGIKLLVVKVEFPMVSAFVRCFVPTVHRKT